MMRQFIHTAKLCLMACVTLCAASCDVHEFADVSNDINGVKVVLNLDFNEEMPLHRELIFTRAAISYEMEYIVEIYRIKDDGTFSDSPIRTLKVTNSELGNLNHTFTTTLPYGKYSVIGWAHYVAEDKSSVYFDFSTLHQISCNKLYIYSGDSDYADSYKANETIEVIEDSPSNEFVIEMTRPMAKYEILADDIDEFMAIRGKTKEEILEDINKGHYTVRIDYSGYVPTQYNIFSNITADAKSGLYFTGPLYLIDEDQALLGFDYVFINPWGGSVSLTLTIYDKNNTAVANTSKLTVPLMQGHLTRMRGHFLTSDNAGVGITPEFVGPDYNIKI